MEQCLHSYFIGNKELRSTCDFIPGHFEGQNYVYEVIRIINSRPLFLDEHFERLMSGCSKSGVFFPGKDVLQRRMKVLVEANKVYDGNIKLMLGSKSQEVNYETAMWFIPSFYPTELMYNEGVETALLHTFRENPNLKVNNPEFKSFAAEKIRKLNVYELLLVNNQMITEGSRSNVFFIAESVIHTAPSENVLVGVTRTKVIEICRDNNIEVAFHNISVNDLSNFEAAFLTGTSPGVIAIKSIKDIGIFKVSHPMITKIAKAYHVARDLNTEGFVW